MRIPLLIYPLAATVLLAADTTGPNAEDIAKNYRKLTRATKEPKSLAARLITDCVAPPDLRAELKRSGPHATKFVHYYHNETAVQPANGAWPVGSVLVKEKLSFGYTDKSIPTAVAGMIKRPAGTFPKSADWEFFWYEKGKLTTTGLESCAGCHTGAARDYVFTDFAALTAKGAQPPAK